MGGMGGMEGNEELVSAALELDVSVGVTPRESVSVGTNPPVPVVSVGTNPPVPVVSVGTNPPVPVVSVGTNPPVPVVSVGTNPPIPVSVSVNVEDVAGSPPGMVFVSVGLVKEEDVVGNGTVKEPLLRRILI